MEPQVQINAQLQYNHLISLKIPTTATGAEVAADGFGERLERRLAHLGAPKRVARHVAAEGAVRERQRADVERRRPVAVERELELAIARRAESGHSPTVAETRSDPQNFLQRGACGG